MGLYTQQPTTIAILLTKFFSPDIFWQTLAIFISVEVTTNYVITYIFVTC